MKKCLYLILFLLVNISYAQDTILAKKIVDSLCSKSFYGRGYVNNGANKAALFIEDFYKKNNVLTLNSLKGWYQQQLSFKVNTFPSEMDVELDHFILTPGVDYVVNPASPSYHQKLKTLFIDSSNCYDKLISTILLEPKKLTKYCLVVNQQSSNDDISSYLFEIIKCGLNHTAVIMLKDEKFTWGSATYQLPKPIIEVQKQIFTEANPKNIDINIHAAFDTVISSNVIGMVKGKTNPDSMIVISAHYDHLGMMGEEAYFLGANDNASGTAMLMDLAQSIAKNPLDETVVFIAFTGEESGLIGSKFFVENTLLDLSKIKLQVNIDIMGGGEKGVGIVNLKEHPKMNTLLQNINDENNYVKRIKVRPNSNNSDHYWFSENDVPAIFIYSDGGVDAYHDINDTPSVITYQYYNGIYGLINDFIKSY